MKQDDRQYPLLIMDDTLLKQAVSFSGHETFVFRYAWPKKAVDAVAADPTIFNQDAAVVLLGVGKNMVRSLRHWGLATGVLAEEPRSRGARLEASEFGRFIFGVGGKDPYLEDPNTLWLLHWNLLRPSNRCTTWQWAFNKLTSNEFTRDSLYDLVLSEVRRQEVKPPSEGILKRDVEAFIRTYVNTRAARQAVIEDSLDCPLVELQLIEQRGTAGHFQLRRGPKPTLNDHVFRYALNQFWEDSAPSRETLSLSEITYQAGSPGSVFKLDEMSIIQRLERIDQSSAGALQYGETAGVRQLYRRRREERFEPLEHFYDNFTVVA